MALHHMALHVDVDRMPGSADFAGVRAAGAEEAAFGQGCGVGHQAGYGLEPVRRFAEVGQGAEEALGVGVQRLAEHLVYRAVLDDFARVHGGDLVAVLGHEAEGVGDEEDGGFIVADESAHEVENLGLDGDVEGRGGLVGEEESGVAGKG